MSATPSEQQLGLSARSFKAKLLVEMRARGEPAGELPRPTANFSTYVTPIEPANFVQMLQDGRQVEQVWPTGTIHPLGTHIEVRPQPEQILAHLYPGREHNGSPTPGHREV